MKSILYCSPDCEDLALRSDFLKQSELFYVRIYHAYTEKCTHRCGGFVGAVRDRSGAAVVERKKVDLKHEEGGQIPVNKAGRVELWHQSLDNLEADQERIDQICQDAGCQVR